MVANLCIFLIVIFLNSISLENKEKVFYGKDILIEEFIVLNAKDNKGVIIALYKEHDWYGKSDFKYFLNGDTLRIDFVDDKIENGVLLVIRNKLKKISYSNGLYFNKYHRLSTKKLPRINNPDCSNKRNVL